MGDLDVFAQGDGGGDVTVEEDSQDDVDDQRDLPADSAAFIEAAVMIDPFFVESVEVG